MSSTADILASLKPAAAKLAGEFLAFHPDAYLVSGSRDIYGQAQAMADNIIRRDNPAWISQTYIKSDARDACQAAVDDLTQPLQEPLVAAAILGALELLTPDQLEHLSWHLRAEAFDAGPVGRADLEADLALRVQRHIQQGGDPGSRLLTREGGMPKLHVQAR